MHLLSDMNWPVGRPGYLIISNRQSAWNYIELPMGLNRWFSPVSNTISDLLDPRGYTIMRKNINSSFYLRFYARLLSMRFLHQSLDASARCDVARETIESSFQRIKLFSSYFISFLQNMMDLWDCDAALKRESTCTLYLNRNRHLHSLFQVSLKGY